MIYRLYKKYMKKEWRVMEELDLKQLLTIFWNKRIHIISIVLIFLVIGTTYTFMFVKPKYQADTKLLLTQQFELVEEGNVNTKKITQSDITLNQKLVSTYSELVKTKNVLREVTKRLGLSVSEEELRKNITVAQVDDTEFIKITVKNANAVDAKNIANEIAKIFCEKVAEIYNINNVTIVDEAEEPQGPYNISHIRDIALFAVAGLVLSVIYVLIFNMLDSTITSAEQIEKELGISVLVSIPVLRDESRQNQDYVKGGIY